MALNIPMPSLPGDALLKGIDTGSNMFSRIMNAKYNNSLHPSGDVANALYIEQLRNQYGEDDPRYLQAKSAHDMAMSLHQSLITNRDVLNKTAGIRFSSPLGKELAEGQGHGAQDILNQKNAPAGAASKTGQQYYDAQGNPIYDNNPRTPEEREAYERSIAKKTSDAAVRNKIPYAENVKITMDSIDPEALVQYSGVPGHAKLMRDTLKAGMGNPPPEFMAYQKSLTSAKTLSKQLRQFWGDSIQPAAVDKIDQLTNPSHWNKNPEVALQQFNQLKDITEQELQTFTKAGRSPIKLNYDKNTDSFFTTDQQKSAAKENKTSKEDEQLLKNWVPQLTQINPQWTEKNIRSTAQQTGLSIGQVIDKLVSKGG